MLMQSKWLNKKKTVTSQVTVFSLFSNITKLIFHLLGGGIVKQGEKSCHYFRIFAAFGDDNPIMFQSIFQKLAWMYRDEIPSPLRSIIDRHSI